MSGRGDLDELTREVMSGFDRGDFRDLLVAMIETPSATGQEGPLAALLTDVMRASGVRAVVQQIDDLQANAVGRIGRNLGDGADLLLYAPIDTHLAPNGDDDLPYLGPELGTFYQPKATVRGWEIAGLGAENPKAYAACVVTTISLLNKVEGALRGEVVAGLGSGGMPVNASVGDRRQNLGHGNGCAYMLQHGVRADYAILAKPVWAVQWEEVGVTWHRVRVHGTFGYSGLRHAVPYDNSVVTASRVIQALEAWLPEYAAAHTSGQVAPQGVVSAVRGGWPSKPAFVSAATDLFLDIRVSPRDDPQDVVRELRAQLRAIATDNPGVRIEHEMFLSIPGSHTPPDNWIIRAMIRAWEAVEGRPHERVGSLSGATDVAILRMWGIPTGRVGIPYRIDGGSAETFGPDPLPMNAVNVEDCQRLVEVLVRSALDTCTRTIDQTRRNSRSEDGGV